MAVYRNTNQDSPIASVEFSPVTRGNSTFFHLKSGCDFEAVKKWLTEDMGQQIEAESHAGNQTYLVTRGEKSQDEIVKALQEKGTNLVVPKPEKAKFKPWIWRGNISIAGQSLQLTSGMMTAKLTAEAKKAGVVAAKSWNPAHFERKGMEGPTVVFAVSNLLANFMNIAFGAQKSPDHHQLAFLKTVSNETIAPYLSEDSKLPGIHEKRSLLRDEPKPPTTWGQRAHEFMKRNSVTVGEIGLRYFGAIALAFPVSRWKAAARTMGAEGLKAGIKEGFNPDSFSGYTGAAYLAGKSIALFSKVPDPYDNTHKHSTIDTIREKYLFKLSSATEAVAAGLLAYNGLTQKKILSKGKLVRDWPGGIGGMLFMSGLVIRMFAPFGTKELNMRELNAHITDSIAQVPIDKIPQATADTAAFLTEHFKDKKFRNQNVEFGKTYTELAADLYRYHNIALPGADGGVGNNVVNVDAAAPANDKVAAFARPEMKKPDLAAMPRPASFQDRTAATPEAAMQRV